MKPHQCSICHKTFKRPRDANMHLRDAHEGDGEIVPTGARRYGVVVGVKDGGNCESAERDTAKES